MTHINTSPQEFSLKGWALLDGQNRQPLSGSLKAGEARAVRVEKPVALSNRGVQSR